MLKFLITHRQTCASWSQKPKSRIKKPWRTRSAIKTRRTSTWYCVANIRPRPHAGKRWSDWSQAEKRGRLTKRMLREYRNAHRLGERSCDEYSERTRRDGLAAGPIGSIG